MEVDDNDDLSDDHGLMENGETEESVHCSSDTGLGFCVMIDDDDDDDDDADDVGDGYNDDDDKHIEEGGVGEKRDKGTDEEIKQLINGEKKKEEDNGEEKKEDDKDEDEEEEEEEEEECKVGLDGGYGWVVVSAAFLAWGLGSIHLNGGGIFFLHFQERFQGGAMLAAWPGSVLWLSIYFNGPLTAAVCNRYSVRTSLMIGTSLIFIGLILTSAVDNFYFLFFCYSLLQGAGLSFMLNPGSFIVSSYFDKRRGFAIAILMSGGAAGNFVIVPLINMLFEAYGYQGCFLILAAILAHGYIVAMLFRPFNVHQKYLLMLERAKNRTGFSTQHVANTDGNYRYTPLTKTTPANKTTDSKSNHDPIKINSIAKSTATIPRRNNVRKPTSCYSEVKTCLKILFPTDYERKENAPRRKMLHFGILKDETYLLFLSGTVLFSVVLNSSFTFIPALCVDQGLTIAEAALVVSIVGGVELFARVGIGFVLDMPKMRPHRVLIFGGLLFVMALMGFCLPSLSSLPSFVLVCSVLNTSIGTHASQRPVVIVELFGKDLLPSCAGITRVFQAFGILTGPLLFGAIRDATGSYDTAFYVSSCLAIVGGVFIILCHVLHQRRVKDKQQQRSGPKQQLTSSV